MPRKADWLRHAGAAVVAVAGTLGVFALSLGMNAQVEKKVVEPVSTVTELKVAPEPKTESAGRKRSSPPKRAGKAAPSPGPLLAAGLAGLDVGLDGGADAALADATAALVGGGGAAVMNEDAVEVAPVPTSRQPPSFPARAR